jgi:hypothetical protein
MKIRLFQELLTLNEEFGHLIHGLERMEKEPTYKKEMIRWAKQDTGSTPKSTVREIADFIGNYYDF